jgi:hypothetical protein
MQENEVDREVRLRELASKLFFTLTAEGSRFALYRDVDVSKPVRHDGLTLDEADTQHMEAARPARRLTPGAPPTLGGTPLFQ